MLIKRLPLSSYLQYPSWRFVLCFGLMSALGLAALFVILSYSKIQTEKSDIRKWLGDEGLLVEIHLPLAHDPLKKNETLDDFLKVVHNMQHIEYAKTYTYDEFKKKFLSSLDTISISSSQSDFVFLQFSEGHKIDWQLLMQDLQAIAKDVHFIQSLTNQDFQKPSSYNNMLFLMGIIIIFLLSGLCFSIRGFLFFNEITFEAFYFSNIKKFMLIKLMLPTFVGFLSMIICTASILSFFYLISPYGYIKISVMDQFLLSASIFLTTLLLGNILTVISLLQSLSYFEKRLFRKGM